MTRTGYTFGGWYTTATGSDGTAYAVGASYSTTANLSLFAKWTAKTHTVTYALDSGSSSASTTQLTGKVVGDTVILPAANTMSKTGYTFAGWSDGTSTYAGGATWTAPASDSDFTLTALWTVVTLSYSYDTNGGGTAPASGTKTYGETLTLDSATSLSKTGPARGSSSQMAADHIRHTVDQLRHITGHAAIDDTLHDRACASGCFFRRLSDDGASCGQSSRHFLAHQVHREVPW